jgi:hypothetical protein
VAYSQALEKKYPKRTNVAAGQNYLSFDSPDGPVSFRCVEKECITQEGGERALFLQWTKKLAWPEAVTTAMTVSQR